MSTILTVSQINTYLKSIIDSDINLKNIYVSGEISNFTNHYRTGHFYFTLKDERSAVKAVMFRSAAQRISFEPENGMKVLVRANLSLYERDGIYQLYCEDIIPEGVGELTLAFEQLKQKLSERGMFDESKKKPLPPYPEKIGVITSPTGAALQDILSVLSRRYPSGEIVFEGVQVQGESAAGQIAAAIRKFNLLKGADVIIVGRGGGSIEDLWAFNEEEVAQAIFDSEIPVISAVGHETDFTISDFVSDLRAPTPSAAAELVAPDYREILYAADKILDSMTDSVERLISRYDISLMSYEKILAENSPERTVMLYSQCLDACKNKIDAAIKSKYESYQSALSNFSARLEGTSPLKVLSRGYSFVKDDNGFTVNSVHKLAVDDSIKIIMADGELDCTVVNIGYK
ncbi:MAG: exodeoxyribonuclease VII large subunit [Ruminococcaceae bacterium]|nr:exodeoxyribonuclease VII large subunit [Oscillospiraceae bacterium]